MTDTDLVNYVRMILRDDAQGKATSARMHLDSEIAAILVVARQEVLRELLAARRQKNVALTISNSLSQHTATEPTAIPVDFLELECGLDTLSLFANTGAYIQSEQPGMGLAMSGSIYRQLYVGSGFFKGTAGVAVYWSGFQQSFVPSGTALTESSEGFYYTLAFYAARELTTAERGHVDDRWKFYDRQYQRRLGSLQ